MALSVVAGGRFSDLEAIAMRWRIIYAKTPQQWAHFGTLFAAYFKVEGPRFRQTERLDLEGGEGRGHRVSAKNPLMVQPSARPLLAYSPDAGSPVSLALAPDLDYGSLKQWSRRAFRRWSHPRGIRRMPSSGRHMDWPKTISSGIRHAGEVVDWQRVRRRPQKLRIVLLLDVSGSMRPHVPFFLGLAWLWTRMGLRFSLFLSSSDVADATTALKRGRPGGKPLMESRALGGGTRLGHAFAWLWNQRRVAFDHRTIFLVASDGFDQGDLRLVMDYFPRFAQVVGRIVWMNPLLLETDYVPKAQALLAALPYCTEHVGVRDQVSWVSYVKTLIMA